MVREGTTDTETFRIIDRLTIRPRRHTCGFESRRGARHVNHSMKEAATTIRTAVMGGNAR